MARKAVLRVFVALCVVAVVPAATLVRYPYLQNVRNDRATILWTTAEAGAGANAWVEYSTDRSFSVSFIAIAAATRFGTTVTGLPPYIQYQAELTGLSPNTDYFYHAVVDDQDLAPGDNDLHFRTAGPGPFNFLAFGDSGQDTPAQRTIAQLMLQELSRSPVDRPSLVLHVGDIAYDGGTFEQFERTYFRYYGDFMKRVPFFTTPGNHEYYTNFAAPYLAVHAPPTDDAPLPDRGRYYSFDWGNVHFVSLDSNRPLADAAKGTGPMLQWLENDLQRTRQTWKIVFFHHTPYLAFNHEDGIDATVRQYVVPILDKYSVDLVLNGHEHNYQHTLPLRGGQVVDAGLGGVYIITGGGGAYLHPVLPSPLKDYQESTNHYMRVAVREGQMRLQAVRMDGQVIDDFVLQPRIPITGDPPKLSTEGIVNAASFNPGVAPGTIVSLFGQNLALRERQASSPLPLPTQLIGTTVTVNARPLPLFYVSPGQINAQLPYGVQGRVTLQVSTPIGAVDVPLTILDTAPGIFTLSPDPAVLHQSGSVVSATSPAQSGETISVFLTGLGEVNGTVNAGDAAPLPPVSASVPVLVQI